MSSPNEELCETRLITQASNLLERVEQTQYSDDLKSLQLLTEHLLKSQIRALRMTPVVAESQTLVFQVHQNN
jgi:hypothetical protein